MLAKRLLEYLLVAFLFVQVVIPMIFGRPIFSIFRRREAARLLAEEKELQLKLEEDRIKDRVAQLRKSHEAHEKEEQPNV